MKRAIICAKCGKPKRFSDSYAVKITDFFSYLTGTEKPEEKRVRVCRVCVRRMGYKIKKKKK